MCTLIVEDDPSKGSLLGRVLPEQVYSIVLTQQGTDAVRPVLKRDFGVVVPFARNSLRSVRGAGYRITDELPQ